jgi:DNA-binding NtrC family response regulator
MKLNKAIIVVADDERLQRETLSDVLREAGHTVLEASNGTEAINHVQFQPVDLVITDFRMPDISGQDVLERVREMQPGVAVVIATAYGTVSSAVEAMKAGATDYLTKPIDLDALEMVVGRILERVELVRENRILRERLEAVRSGMRLLGHADNLRQVMAKAGRAAETDATVLVLGESGTGKELLARSVHDLSRRAEGPFIAVNCAALPETLLESELFGHEKGAFTGAQIRHRGRVELAEGGTLFLDEIGDISPPVQVKLLRFLQERVFMRLGGESDKTADVRIISATHRNLEELMLSGQFRDDLYYRLNVVGLTLPPLRERREDIAELVEHFLVRSAKRYSRAVTSISHEAMDLLVKYNFPGNVRELENLIEQAVVLARSEVIRVSDLPPRIAGTDGDAEHGTGIDAVSESLHPDRIDGNLTELLSALEKRAVLDTLAQFNGNQSRAARHLGLTESGLRYKLSRWRDQDES